MSDSRRKSVLWAPSFVSYRGWGTPDKGYAGRELGPGWRRASLGYSVAKAVRPESDKVLRQRPTGLREPDLRLPRAGLWTGTRGCTAAPPRRRSHRCPAPRPAQPARAPRARPPGTPPHREPTGTPGLREPPAVPHAQQPCLRRREGDPSMPLCRSVCVAMHSGTRGEVFFFFCILC